MRPDDEAIGAWVHYTIGRFGGLQRNIAADVWPNGVILSCHCGHSEAHSSSEAGGYLAKGWPKHCGRTMSCDKA